jgi:hypothetical protein
MTDKYEKYVEGIDFSNMPEVARPAMIALGQFQCGDTIDQICPRCDSPITVEAKSTTPDNSPSAWFVSCECGECNGAFRGL